MKSAATSVSRVLARSRRAILELLKTHGPSSAAQLSRILKVSAMAVRQHLYAMQEQKLVRFEEATGRVGRPTKQWQLTAEATRYFPDAHAELATSLLKGIRQTFGQTGMEQIMASRSQQQVAAYQTALAREKTLGAKLKALAWLRTVEGYMAEAVREKAGTWLLIENHCPVCRAAQTCAGLCQAELGVFQTVLGPAVRLERTEHILSGARRCVYRINENR